MTELRLVVDNPAPARRRTPQAHVTKIDNLAIIERWLVSSFQLVEREDGIVIRLRNGCAWWSDLYLCATWSLAEGALFALRHEHARPVLPPLRLAI